MTPAQYKKIAKIKEDLAKIRNDLVGKIEKAVDTPHLDRDKSTLLKVMELSTEYGAIVTVIDALDSVV